MIQRLSIENFKSFTEFECSFASFSIIVSTNNSGKTSILQAIHVLTSLVQAHGLRNRQSTEQFVLGLQQLLYLPTSQVSAITPINAPLGTITKISVDLRSSEHATETVTAAIQFRPDDSVEVTLTNPAALEPLRDLANQYAIHLSGFPGLADDEGFVGFGALRRSVVRGHAHLFLRNALRELSEDRVTWQDFSRTVRDVFPDVDLEVKYDPKVDEQVTVMLNRGVAKLPLDASGTGTIHAIHILAYLFLFKPRVLLLDEPDSHLHPDNQRRMVRALWQFSEKGYTQVIATTHSRHVLDAKPEPAKLLVVSSGKLVKEAGEQPATLLMELGAIDDMELLSSGKVKCVVATEDTNIEEIEHVVFSSGFVRDETLICSYAGCSKIDLAVVLSTFIRQYAPGVSLVIHRDRDYLPEADILKARAELEKVGINFFVTTGSDIETHYLLASHVVTAHPTLSPQQATEAVDRAIERGKGESIKAYIRARTGLALRERNKKDDRAKFPDFGEIAVACHKDVENSPRSYVYGKHTLGLLKSELQVILKSNANLYIDSPYLADAGLQSVASKIWPQNADVAAPGKGHA